MIHLKICWRFSTMKIFRKLYNWVLHWAETPYGPLALFLLALAETSPGSDALALPDAGGKGKAGNALASWESWPP